MRYQTFGKTGLELSQITLGTWGIGGAGWDTYSDEERLDAIAAAIDCGINFIDTAPAYNAGASERYVGRALSELGVRNKVYISTKCGNEFIGGKYVRNGKKEAILRQCEESLTNLRTDHIDVYLIHWPDPAVPFEETMEALNELKAAGKILHVGVSNFSKEQIEAVSQYCDIEVFQPHYSMVFRGQEQLIRWAHEQGLGIMAYGSLGGGILTGRYRQVQTYEAMDSRNRFYQFFKEPQFSEVMKLLAEMDRFAEEKKVGLSEIALNWTAQKPYIDTCIMGAQTRDKVERNALAMNWQLTEEEIASFDRVLAGLKL